MSRFVSPLIVLVVVSPLLAMWWAAVELDNNYLAYGALVVTLIFTTTVTITGSEGEDE